MLVEHTPLHAQADAWDGIGGGQASAALDKDRFRQGLGRSTDPKVEALRQAVLEKCVAVRGPSPNQGALTSPGLHWCRLCAAVPPRQCTMVMP